MTHLAHQMLLLVAVLALASAAVPQDNLYARFGGWSYVGGVPSDTLAVLSSDLTSFKVFSAGRTSFSYGVGYCDGWMWGAEPINTTMSYQRYQVVKSRVDDGTRFNVGPLTSGSTVACDSKAGRIYMLGLEGIFSMKTDGSDLQTFFQFPKPWPYTESMRYLMVRGDVAYYRVEGYGIMASSNKTGTTTVLYSSGFVGGFDVRDDGFLYFANKTTLMRASSIDGSGLQVLSNSGEDMRGLAVYGQKILVGDGNAAFSFNLDGTGKTRMFNYTKGVGPGCIFTYQYQGSSSGGGGGGAPAAPSSGVRLGSLFAGLWHATAPFLWR